MLLFILTLMARCW